MGQQQLLLLVLGIVIVGLAVVVGISTFAENKEKAQIDRYTSVGVAMAGDLVAYYHKPTTTGGAGEDGSALGSVTVDDLGYTRTITDTHAGYNRTGVGSGGVVRHLMQSATHPVFHIHEDRAITAGDMRVEVYVFGPDKECIVTRHGRVDEPWSDGNNDATPPDNPNSAVCAW